MQAHVHFNPISKLQVENSLNLYFDKPIKIISIFDTKQIKFALEEIWQYSLNGLWCVGFISYDAAPAFDSSYIIYNKQKNFYPLLHFAIYNNFKYLPLKHLFNKNVNNFLTPQENFIQKNSWNINSIEYEKRFLAIHQAILAGDVYQINYTQNFEKKIKNLNNNFSWINYYYQLLAKQAQSYSLYLNWQETYNNINHHILSFSPELFFHWQPNQHILTQPMKGTAKRHANLALDKIIEQKLITSPKEKAENIMIVDLLRNDLSRIAQIGSIKTSNIFETLALPSVWQMVSSISAKTQSHISLYDVFKALFPCGSITGTPKIQAMKLIAQLENYKRGLYCGAIGIIKPYGECIFNVAIRTLQAHKYKNTHYINYGVGSGITIDANAQAEIIELQNKMSFLYN